MDPEEPQSVAELLRAHGFGAVRGGSALHAAGVSLGRPGEGAAMAQAAAVSHGLPLQSLWIIPTAAVSEHVVQAADLVAAVGSERGSQRTVHRVLRHD